MAKMLRNVGYTFPSLDAVDNANVVYVTWLAWLATASRCLHCNSRWSMSNVYIVKAGNSIVSHHSGWEFRVFPMLKVPPLCARYIRERVSGQLFAYVFAC